MILTNIFKYEFSNEQIKKYNKWKKKLPKINEGAIGGRYTMEFTQTGIGLAVVIKTSEGHEIDLTEYNKW